MNKDKILDLLYELDDAARSVCNYDFGLPLHKDEERERAVEIVETWFARSF